MGLGRSGSTRVHHLTTLTQSRTRRRRRVRRRCIAARRREGNNSGARAPSRISFHAIFQRECSCAKGDFFPAESLSWNTYTYWPGTKLEKNLGGAKQRQLARKEVQQISAPPTYTSTVKISYDSFTGLRLLASGRGAGAP